MIITSILFSLIKIYIYCNVSKTYIEKIMITLSNGHEMTHVVASGALAFDGRGWPWERPLSSLGIIKPELFTVVSKSVTVEPVKGNLRWFHPWTCVQLLKNGGVVNKVGLTNKGFDWFCQKVLPKIEKRGERIIVSLFGTKDELRYMARLLREYGFNCVIGLEINVSCPNTGHDMDKTQEVIDSVKTVYDVQSKPIIVKVSVDQDYLAIAKGLAGIADAISINSVPWHIAFPEDKDGATSPLIWLMNKLKQKNGNTGGGGGVSGKPAQSANWKAVAELAKSNFLPVIGPSIMCKEDIAQLQKLGAKAFSFGAIHIRTPWKPTQIIQQLYKKQYKTN
jgi:dihydroorotate dehydrogenase (NAD+) catalytic subunit